MPKFAQFLILLLFILSTVRGDDSKEKSLFKFPELEEDDESEEKSLEKDILVIPNRFPKRLNWFCEPRNELMRDRLCFGEVDAFALACANDSPPIQLVPFCLGYKHQCSKANFPEDSWCEKEFDHYDRFCTRMRKNPCKSTTHDISCYCDPYDRLWLRYGFETARWCQKYELVCDEKSRRAKGSDLVELMQDTLKVHYRCLHLFNLANVICDPFSTRFDWYRCMKFIFDCELISEWEEDDLDEVGLLPAEEEIEKAKERAKQEEKEKKIAIIQESISDTTEKLLKAGIPKEKLKENAEIFEKEQELATLLKTP
ncbi:unnamed protein product [Caenorhabditis bovis]|uniref:Domain of unknown function DB domain-containing protein n=1 Tax=Caenorhabditis bovis TaxID=2654633 RepID=A0A8S1EZJ1_9PELO|nr:unnamed protein product [Caenorhabditis bovis]